MNYDEARRLLLRHGPGTEDSSGEPGWLKNGFLGTLRPYQGLLEQNFHTVLEALLIVGQQFHTAPLVDRELTHALWDLCWTARVWGLEPDGMLQRNKLITAADTALLRRWVEILEICSLRLLRGSPPYSQVNSYAEYILAYGPGENVDFFIPLMCQYLDNPDSTDPEPIPQALAKLGPRAASALPSLRAASQRKYADYCHAEA
jgi:hypothetical protein